MGGAAFGFVRRRGGRSGAGGGLLEYVFLRRAGRRRLVAENAAAAAVNPLVLGMGRKAGCQGKGSEGGGGKGADGEFHGAARLWVNEGAYCASRLAARQCPFSGANVP